MNRRLMDRWKTPHSTDVGFERVYRFGTPPRLLAEWDGAKTALKVKRAFSKRFPEIDRALACYSADKLYVPPKRGKNWYGDDRLVHSTTSVVMVDGEQQWLTGCWREIRFDRHTPRHFVKNPVTCFACLVDAGGR